MGKLVLALIVGELLRLSVCSTAGTFGKNLAHRIPVAHKIGVVSLATLDMGKG